MPDMERMMERMLEGLALLTQQVSRLAHATEMLFSTHVNKDALPRLKKCRACSSTIQRHDATQCMACGEHMTDG